MWRHLQDLWRLYLRRCARDTRPQIGGRWRLRTSVKSSQTEHTTKHASNALKSNQQILVLFTASRAFISAPFSTKDSTTGNWLFFAAAMSGIGPLLTHGIDYTSGDRTREREVFLTESMIVGSVKISEQWNWWKWTHQAIYVSGRQLVAKATEISHMLDDDKLPQMQQN